MKKYITISILSAIIVLFTFAIFYYSLEMSDESQKRSYIVTKTVETLIENNDDLTTAELQHIIRKFAHVLEYGGLGILVSVLMIYIKKQYNKTYYGFVLFFLLLAAVTDEYIQRFYKRSSTVGDIVLDFLSSLLGAAVAYGIYSLIKYIKKRIYAVKSQ